MHGAADLFRRAHRTIANAKDKIARAQAFSLRRTTFDDFSDQHTTRALA